MKRILSFVLFSFYTFPLFAQNNVILYEATSKLEEVSDPRKNGIYINAFSVNIVSHEYEYETDKGVITFDGDISSIGNAAFNDCEFLTSIDIPNSVSYIGDSAFYGCNRLTTIVIPKGVLTIGKWAFRYCNNLNKIELGDKVSYIGDCAFDGTALVSVIIPNSVIELGDSVFYYCTKLSSVEIGNSVKKWFSKNKETNSIKSRIDILF